MLNAGGDGALRIKAARDGASPFHPNADQLFLSAAELALRCTVVVLSGMGKDGARERRGSKRRERRFTCRNPTLASLPGCRALRLRFAATRGPLIQRRRPRR